MCGCAASIMKKHSTQHKAELVIGGMRNHTYCSIWFLLRILDYSLTRKTALTTTSLCLANTVNRTLVDKDSVLTWRRLHAYLLCSLGDGFAIKQHQCKTMHHRIYGVTLTCIMKPNETIYMDILNTGANYSCLSFSLFLVISKI